MYCFWASGSLRLIWSSCFLISSSLFLCSNSNVFNSFSLFAFSPRNSMTDYFVGFERDWRLWWFPFVSFPGSFRRNKSCIFCLNPFSIFFGFIFYSHFLLEREALIPEALISCLYFWIFFVSITHCRDIFHIKSDVSPWIQLIYNLLPICLYPFAWSKGRSADISLICSRLCCSLHFITSRFMLKTEKIKL